MSDIFAPDLEVDVLVLGSGIAGMTVAGTAAEARANVLVAERAPTLGGSSVWSGGFVWTAKDEEDFVAFDPGGDTRKFHLMRGGFDDAIDWVRDHGILVGPTLNDILGFGSGNVIDVPHFVRRMKAVVEGAGGWVLTNNEGVELITEGGVVVGARLRDITSNEETLVAARSVVLATGGVHAGAEMRERFNMAGGAGLLVRGNPYSDGTGVLIGEQAGGAVSETTSGYYGHPMPYPLGKIEEGDRTALAMYHSEHSIVMNHDGKRFFDESEGYWIAAMEIAAQGTAILVTDEKLRQEHILNPTQPGHDHDLLTDKMALAGERGGRYAKAETLEALGAAVNAWGYDGDAVINSVNEFNEQVQDESTSTTPERRRNRVPLSQPPYEVIEVQGSVTFAYPGLYTNDDGQVLDVDGAAIKGLYAAGIDSHVNVICSTGGLVRGLVLGRRTGAAVTADVAVAPAN